MSAPPAYADWRAEAERETLVDRQRAIFARRKPAEQLFDLHEDPHQMHDLAADPGHRVTLERLRAACESWMLEVRDLGFLAEHDRYELSIGTTPHDLARDAERYPLERLLDVAGLASRRDPALAPEFVRLLDDEHRAVRRWAAIGLDAIGVDATSTSPEAVPRLLAALGDPAETVRVAAASALCGLGRPDEALSTLAALIHHESGYLLLDVLTAIDSAGEAARPLLPLLEGVDLRPREGLLGTAFDLEVYVYPLVDAIVRRLGGERRRLAMVDMAGTRDKFYD